MKIFLYRKYFIFFILYCIISCIPPAEPVEERKLIRVKKFSVRVPSTYIACGLKLGCLNWRVKIEDENTITLRRDWPLLGNQIRRNTIIQVNANPIIYREKHILTNKEKEALLSAIFHKFEEDINEGIDVWHRTMPLAASLKVAPEKLNRETLALKGKTLYRLYWKSQKRAMTLIPSYKVVEGAIYLYFSPYFESDFTIYSFIFWEQYDSGLAPKNSFRQIEQVISTFQPQ